MAPFISVPSANCVGSHAQKHWVEVKSHYSDPYWHPVKDVRICVRLKDGIIKIENLSGCVCETEEAYGLFWFMQ